MIRPIIKNLLLMATSMVVAAVCIISAYELVMGYGHDRWP